MFKTVAIAVGPNLLFFFLQFWVKGMPPFIAKIAFGMTAIVLILCFLPINQKYLTPIALILFGITCSIAGGALFYARYEDDSEQAQSSAIEKLDRPKLELQELKFVYGSNRRENLLYPMVNVFVKNYGKTAAFIDGLGVGQTLGERKEKISAAKSIDVPAGVIADAGELKLVGRSHPSTTFLQADVDTALNAKSGVTIYGYVKYRDADGNRYTLPFCKIYKDGNTLIDPPGFFDCSIQEEP